MFRQFVAILLAIAASGVYADQQRVKEHHAAKPKVQNTKVDETRRFMNKKVTQEQDKKKTGAQNKQKVECNETTNPPCTPDESL